MGAVDVRVFLTAIGCPGGLPLVKALKREGAYVIGVDANPDVIARHYVDEFWSVPPGDSALYTDAIQKLIHCTKPDVLFPQSSSEALALSSHDFGISVVVANHTALLICLDKHLTYSALATTTAPLPRYRLCHIPGALISAVFDLGYPDRRVIIKPTTAKGSRGLRVITPDFNRLITPWREWPGVVLLSMNELILALKDVHRIPFPLLAVEYLDGLDCTIDVYCRAGRILLSLTKYRQRTVHTGMHTANVAAEDDKLEHHAATIVAKLNLDGFASVQFLGGKLLEVNPRISTQIYTDDFNMPWLGIQHTLGYLSDDDLLTHRIEPGAQAIYHWDLWCSEVAL